MKKSILILTLLLPIFALAQKNDPENQIKKNLAKYQFGIENKSIYEEPDSLLKATVNQLKKILKYHAFDSLSLTENEYYPFQISHSKDSLIYIYSLNYNSGGTAGVIYNPIIQWKKSDGTYGVFELFPSGKRKFEGIEASFYKIIKLPAIENNLYLLIGNTKGSGRMYAAKALVIEIKNDFLILDYPAFFKQEPLLVYFDYTDSYFNNDNFCIACLEYDEKKKLLFVEDLGIEDSIGISKNGYIIQVPMKHGKNGKISFYFDGYKFIRRN